MAIRQLNYSCFSHDAVAIAAPAHILTYYYCSLTMVVEVVVEAILDFGLLNATCFLSCHPNSAVGNGN